MKIGPLKCEEFIAECSQCAQLLDCNPRVMCSHECESCSTHIVASVYRYTNVFINSMTNYVCLYYTPSTSKLLSDFAQDIIDYLKRIDAKLETMVSTNGK